MKNARLLLAVLVLALTATACGTSSITGPDQAPGRPAHNIVWGGSGG